MTPSRRQFQPKRPIAEFGKQNNPLFRVDEGRIPGEEQPKDTRPFIIRDSDEALPDRLIAAGELSNIDREAGTADINLEIDTGASEATYKLSPGDMRVALGAIMQDADVERGHFAEATNVSEETLHKIGCEAVYDEVELSLSVAA